MNHSHSSIENPSSRMTKVRSKAERLVASLHKEGLFICAVESCTGGALANAISNIPGASEILKDSFITYSTEAKIALGVTKKLIEKHTVYSEEVAVAMATVGLEKSVRADIGVGITGSLSRVDPANPNSIPGEVYIAAVTSDYKIVQSFNIPEPNREQAKLHIVECALDIAYDLLKHI